METPRMSPSLTGADGVRVTEGEVFSFPLHTHSYYELIFYLPFRGEVAVNGTVLAPSSPIAVLMTPEDLHAVKAEGAPSHFLKIAFTEDALGGYLAKQTDGAYVLRPRTDSSVSALLDRFKESLPYAEKVILLRAAVLLLLTDGERIPSPTRSATHTLAAEAVAILHDEFTGDVTLHALARRLCVSHQHLSACFKKGTGLPFSVYLTALRLRHARALLASTSDPITEICYACGYRNLSHFLRSFRKKYGETPREYRTKLASPD